MLAVQNPTMPPSKARTNAPPTPVTPANPHPHTSTPLTNISGHHDLAHAGGGAQEDAALLRGGHHRVQRHQLVPAAGQGWRG